MAAKLYCSDWIQHFAKDRSGSADYGDRIVLYDDWDMSEGYVLHSTEFSTASVAIVVAHHPDQKVPDFLYISQPWPQWAWRSHLGPAFDVIGEPPNA
ncbi:MAG: hypothetical protein P4L69_07260, partial [Desulfosporosinus sp.]|nr:hypothetical protein [Desulfosporosinus sp.]